jgi:hypothetical protein
VVVEAVDAVVVHRAVVRLRVGWEPANTDCLVT